MTFLQSAPPPLYMYLPVSKKSLQKEERRQSKTSRKQERRRRHRRADRRTSQDVGLSGSNESAESASDTAEVRIHFETSEASGSFRSMLSAFIASANMQRQDCNSHSQTVAAIS